MKKLELRIQGNTIRYIYDDMLVTMNELGQTETVRASHVEPVGSEWFVDLTPSNGPKLGPFKLRQEALDAEIEWIIQNQIPVPKPFSEA